MEYKMNFLERAMMVVSPEKAVRRYQWRQAAGIIMDEVRKYDAAGRGRKTSSWETTGGSANQEIARGRMLTTNRSRDLVRNNPYAARAIQALATNIVGTGITPLPKLESGQQEQLKALFNEWADSTDCDFDGQLNLSGLDHLITHTMAESGSVIVRKRVDRTKKIPLQLQVLEPDYIDRSKNTPVRSDGNYQVQGIEFNSKGKRVGYWLYSHHPGDGFSGSVMSKLVPMEEIIHAYEKKRPGQVDGMPWLHSSVNTLYDIDEYEQAQIVRQKIAACFSVFITDTNANGTPSTKTTKKIVDKVSPGMIQYLGAGQDVQMANPPTVQNGEYLTAVLRKAAAGIGITYEVLTGDLSNVNFSSGRMGWLEMHRLINHWQMQLIVPMVKEPVWRWFMEFAFLMGKWDNADVKAFWTLPRREMIDPLKEIQALSHAVRNGFESWSSVVQQFGYDPATLLKQISKDFENFKKEGLMLVCDPEFDPQRKDEEPDGDEEELTPAQQKNIKKAKNGK